MLHYPKGNAPRLLNLTLVIELNFNHVMAEKQATVIHNAVSASPFNLLHREH